MSAVLNTNTASLWAAKNLLGAQNRLAASVERLSSGLRINRARDDAAGLGVANSLTAQINGANQGMRNLNDAISMVQTGEGAISAASEMGQRILMLATQGANGTLGVAERRAIHREMAEHLSSIGSIGSRTQFSGNPLLHVGTSAAADGIAYSMQISNTASDRIELRNSAFRNIGGTSLAVTEEVRFTISGALANGNELTVTDGVVSRKLVVGAGGATAEAVATALQSGTTAGSITVTDTGIVTGVGGRWTATRSGTSVTFVSATATTNVNDLVLVNNGHTLATVSNYTQGASADQEGQASTLKSKVDALNTALTASETGGETDGERTTVTDAFREIQTAANNYVIALGTQRSVLGAYQNQMEYTLANITELSSNLSSARSRVIDTDYASETAMLTRGQILQQAATAMLAQANQMPNVILTLLK